MEKLSENYVEITGYHTDCSLDRRKIASVQRESNTIAKPGYAGNLQHWLHVFLESGAHIKIYYADNESNRDDDYREIKEYLVERDN